MVTNEASRISQLPTELGDSMSKKWMCWYTSLSAR